jgi:hypothetical protein
MTFSDRVRASAAAVLLVVAPSLWAKDSLGEIHSSVAGANVSPSGVAAGERHLLAQNARYSMDEVQLADGSRIHKYLADNGQIFAVSWNTLYKPDLSLLLGTHFSSYAGATKLAGKKGGIQRQFHHEANDLVVQSGGHLHVFSGYAYLRSQFPAGVNPQLLGWQ